MTKDLPNDKKALEAIKKEVVVKEAIITDANILYISVKANGEKQLGYAHYFCTMLYQYHAKTNMVKIVEHGTASDKNGYGTLLGECYCPSWIEGFEGN